MSLPISPSGRYFWHSKEKRFVPIEWYSRPKVKAPNIMRDIETYKSPLGTGEITSRSHRREDLKRGGCREVDPSEFNAVYHNPKFARRLGKEWTPPDSPKGAEFGGLIDRKPASD